MVNPSVVEVSTPGFIPYEVSLSIHPTVEVLHRRLSPMAVKVATMVSQSVVVILTFLHIKIILIFWCGVNWLVYLGYVA